MTCIRLETCNIDPLLGLLFVITLLLAGAVLFKRDKLGRMFRAALEVALNILTDYMSKLTGRNERGKKG